jgi:hypothetical protein
MAAFAGRHDGDNFGRYHHTRSPTIFLMQVNSIQRSKNLQIYIYVRIKYADSRQHRISNIARPCNRCWSAKNYNICYLPRSSRSTGRRSLYSRRPCANPVSEKKDRLMSYTHTHTHTDTHTKAHVCEREARDNWRISANGMSSLEQWRLHVKQPSSKQMAKYWATKRRTLKKRPYGSRGVCHSFAVAHQWRWW